MPFKKGYSGNLKGRPKGKAKRPIKSVIEKLLENSLPLIEHDLKNKPEERQVFFKDLTRIIITSEN